MDAYQQFMLAGTGKQTTPNKTTTPSKQKKSPEKRSPINNPSSLTPNRSALRRYTAIYQTFCRSTQNDYLHHHNELERILQSLLDVRGNLVVEEKVLSAYTMDCNNKSWMHYGLRNRVKGIPSAGKYLVKTDVQSAHHHDLLQHEKLLAMLRRFGKKLYKAHCALGRHLDEMLRHHLSVAADDDVCTQNVDQVNQVYHELSRELYHCQKLLEIVLDSDMLDRQVVGRCCKEWRLDRASGNIDMGLLRSMNIMN
mmetsp:Transcript_9846/g.14764  ORF Transcript_9846/g.14764 Transcript_9846/m.14764 type:complete len:253 (-) Transcript_9846:73-831(-)|eukprot:CAMPEP_0116021380 /NCGR_PEP_ID=MMETSP0321-20121206/10353_1 /TAXON_ID=163516 /ORGANISM="Leptocylindrus danicus var. danicus, Strain B650" /LENGTH=252 /DNA_ID=CAMNT_0003492241 /DNA_START=415 /DNA_END=1173 /DNA_ORIENTATION=+